MEVSSTQNGRELGVRTGSLRAWAKQVADRAGAAPRDVFPGQGRVPTAHGITCSMSRKGDRWDNAVAESFSGMLEHELLADEDFPSRQAARRAIFEFLEVWYNRERRHSRRGDVSPAEYEARQQAA